MSTAEHEVSPGAISSQQNPPPVAQALEAPPEIQPVASFQVPPPEKFSFKPEDWPKWIQRFERFRKATGLEKRSGKNQVNTLIYAMGDPLI